MGKPANSQIITRQRQRAPNVNVPKPLVELAQGDPRVLTKVVLRFEKILAHSFQQNPVRGSPTRAMVKERFAILERWYKALRADKKWGVTRILDSLADALHAELNGQTWQPDKRACWMPGDGQ